MDRDEIHDVLQQNLKNLMPPNKNTCKTPFLGARHCHPVMWPNEPLPSEKQMRSKRTKIVTDKNGNKVIVEIDEEAEREVPHHRIVRNIRRFFTEAGNNTELRNAMIENMLLALPSCSKDTK